MSFEDVSRQKLSYPAVNRLVFVLTFEGRGVWVEKSCSCVLLAAGLEPPTIPRGEVRWDPSLKRHASLFSESGDEESLDGGERGGGSESKEAGIQWVNRKDWKQDTDDLTEGHCWVCGGKKKFVRNTWQPLFVYRLLVYGASIYSEPNKLNLVTGITI